MAEIHISRLGGHNNSKQRMYKKKIEEKDGCGGGQTDRESEREWEEKTKMLDNSIRP